MEITQICFLSFKASGQFKLLLSVLKNLKSIQISANNLMVLIYIKS